MGLKWALELAIRYCELGARLYLNSSGKAAAAMLRRWMPFIEVAKEYNRIMVRDARNAADMDRAAREIDRVRGAMYDAYRGGPAAARGGAMSEKPTKEELQRAVEVALEACTTRRAHGRYTYVSAANVLRAFLASGLTDSERETVAAARGMLLEKFVYGCQDEAYRGNNAIVARAVDALSPIAEGK